jgi:hypothetical protein
MQASLKASLVSSAESDSDAEKKCRLGYMAKQGNPGEPIRQHESFTSLLAKVVPVSASHRRGWRGAGALVTCYSYLCLWGYKGALP